jgi:hypothetical protein
MQKMQKMKPQPGIPTTRTCPDGSKVTRGRMCPPIPGIPSKPKSKPSRAQQFKRERLGK